MGLQILELAAWKFMCTRDFPEPFTSESQAISWRTEKWKKSITYKEKFFRCREIMIIMDVVTPFIKNWSPPEELPPKDETKEALTNMLNFYTH